MSENTAIPVKRDDTLKFIALVTMLIDHIGYLLFPQHFFLRMIGRMAFPIFAYLIAKGALRTQDPKKYVLRLLLFSFVSQIPYNLFTHRLWWTFTDPNIFFTLLAGLLMVLCLKQDRWPIKLLGLGVFLLVEPLNLQYSYYGILLILCFYLFDGKKLLLSAAFLLATLQFYWQFHNPYQFYALPVLLFIFFTPKLGIQVNKAAAYWFYPIHQLVLFGIYLIWF